MKHELQSTQTFKRWLSAFKDRTTRNKVLSRLDRVSNGNFGDHKALDAGLFELRFVFGAGLRIYYTLRNGQVVLLLAGGDKSSQQRDIEAARAILKSLGD